MILAREQLLWICKHKLFDSTLVDASMMDLKEQLLVMPAIKVQQLVDEEGRSVGYYKDLLAIQRRDNANPILGINQP